MAPYKRLPVIEIFGPTIQGEGRLLGQVTHFIRLGGCDYRCQWCDSMHSVDPAAVKQNKEDMSAEQIVKDIVDLPRSKWVTISGGNPGIHDLTELIKELQVAGYNVAVETQGSMFKKWFSRVQQLTLAPKGPSARVGPTDYNVLEMCIDSNSTSILKVVIANDDDIKYAKDLLDRFSVPMWLQVCNLAPYQPRSLWKLRDDLLTDYRYLVEKILKDPDFYSVRITPQMHTLLWGSALGR